eukprot:TRINITY_DN472_c0_g13_i1.p1 TRINITY_DN472_c0_g13~~TRINITY_DN472_c0_g13_i1.p1  ORF type:complete len:174 (+),score=10.35 TRINITY_DN472_c0_g13_i1:207-728(+)
MEGALLSSHFGIGRCQTFQGMPGSVYVSYRSPSNRCCLSSPFNSSQPRLRMRLSGKGFCVRVSSSRIQRLRRSLNVKCQTEALELTEGNVEAVLEEARTELLQLFDETVGITGVAELADLDGPFVTLRLRGRFWHERSLVLARLGHYLQTRIPEILEVSIENVDQLDDSPSNF